MLRTRASALHHFSQVHSRNLPVLLFLTTMQTRLALLLALGLPAFAADIPDRPEKLKYPTLN